MSALLTSCTTLPLPFQGKSPTHDILGHRPRPKGFNVVIIDAGHGSKDSGAVSRTTKQKEKDLALVTAKRIRDELAPDFKVIFMRSSDSFIELDDRIARVNRSNAAILVSAHNNSGPKTCRGPETYYWRVDSHGLATRLQQAMSRDVACLTNWRLLPRHGASQNTPHAQPCDPMRPCRRRLSQSSRRKPED